MSEPGFRGKYFQITHTTCIFLNIFVQDCGVTLGHVKALALVDVLAYTLAGNKRRTPGETLSGDAA